MKKVLPVVAILLLLVGAFFVVSQPQSGENSRDVRWKIPAADPISRIEIERPVPLADEGRQKVVLGRTGESWNILEPVEAGVPKHFERKLNSMFSTPIEMDDIALPAKNLDQYGLDEKSRLNVKLFVPNSEPIEITMGLGFKIDGTDATRTYVLSPAGKVYRARTDAGIAFAQPLSLMRDKNLFNLAAEQLSVIVVENDEGTYRFVRDGMSGWKVAEPSPGFALEQPLMKNIERQLTTFRVRSFRQGSPSDWGLDEPDAKVTAGTIEGDIRLDVKAVDEDGRRVYIAAIGQGGEIVELLPTLGLALTAGKNMFRDRLVREIGRGKISRVELAGADRVAIERVGPQAWKQVRPIDGEVSPKELGKFLGNLERFSVIRYSDVSPADAGLREQDGPSRVVAVTTDDVRHVLFLGKESSSGDGYLARWEDDDEVFVIPEYLYDRFHPAPTTLLME